MGTDLFTTGYLGGFTGLVAVTYLLVQFFKEPMKKYFSDWWVRMLAVVFALTIQSFTLYYTGHFTMETVFLAVLNSFLVAITAAGAHNVSQNSTTPNNVLDVAKIMYDLSTTKPQVTDVSPPIMTPQQTKDATNDLTSFTTGLNI